MKRALVVLTTLFALFLVVEKALAAPAVQNDDPPLTLNVEWPDEKNQVGQNIIMTVNYTNNALPLAADTTFNILVQVVTQNEDSLITSCGGPVEALSGLATNGQGVFSCTLAVNQAGSYLVRTQVTGENDAVIATAESENKLEVTSVSSALSTEIGQLFAGLGMFAAIMAIVAVGTEVIIDSSKVFLGMKSKVTALDALDRMEKLIPGQLEALGVDSASREEFARLAGDMRQTLNGVVQPVAGFRQLVTAIEQGSFGDVYRELDKLIPQTGQLSAQGLTQVQDHARQALSIVDTIGRELHLDAAFTNQIKSSLQDQINRVTINSAPTFIEQFFSTLQDRQNNGLLWLEQIAEKWVPAQFDRLLSDGETAVMDLFDNQVRPQLEGLGLPKETVNNTRSQIELLLKSANTQAGRATQTYLTSVENLLDSVEKRRHETQSPMRKYWRRLRIAGHGTATLSLSAGAAIGLLVLLIKPLLADRFEDVSPLLVALLSFLAATILAFILIKIAARLGQRYYDRQPTLDNAVRNTTLTDLQRAEFFWNYLRGNDRLPADYDRALTIQEWLGGKALTATNLADLVMDRNDKQRDEEASRLRWLRVISVIIGFILAYLLQIDAAVLLDAAVPGVSGTINNILSYDGKTLQRFLPFLSAERSITAGIILTGLAASAGSTFWHDQLDRLQKAKQGTETAVQMLEQVQQGIKQQTK